MRSLPDLSRGLLLGASLVALGSVAALIPAAALAQSCDYQVVTARWHPHPSPDSIYIDFSVDVTTDVPVSADSTQPSEFPTQVAMHFNGAPLIPSQDLIMLWWQRMSDCSGSSCPGVVCEVKQWMYKDIQFRDQSICARNSSGVCGCPPLGTPVVEHKPVPKPGGPGWIDVEIVPLGLQSCNPINPQNDKKQFYYDPNSSGGGVPGMSRPGGVLLAASLLLLGLLVLRRRETGGMA